MPGPIRTKHSSLVEVDDSEIIPYVRRAGSPLYAVVNDLESDNFQLWKLTPTILRARRTCALCPILQLFLKVYLPYHYLTVISPFVMEMGRKLPSM